MANLWLVFNFYFCVQSYYFLHNWKEMISKQPSLIYLGRTHIYFSLLLFLIFFYYFRWKTFVIVPRLISIFKHVMNSGVKAISTELNTGYLITNVP